MTYHDAKIAAQGDTQAEPEEAVAFEPVNLLAELKKKAAEPRPDHLPDRLPLFGITQLPELFQPRGISERHVSELARVIANNGVVDPVTVIQVGPEVVLIDGHHRLAAYAQEEVTEGIPVIYFEGTLEEAVLEAGRANSKAKLPMASRERQDYAWRLVLMDRYSKAEVAEASGVSTSQIANMRKVKKGLGDRAFECQAWWKALKLAQGSGIEMSDDDREQWKEEKANDFADRLVKAFGMKLAKDPEIAARALAIYFGRKLGEVYEELIEHLGEGELQAVYRTLQRHPHIDLWVDEVDTDDDF